MKKKILLFLFLLIISPVYVFATDVYSISVDVNILKNGDAHIVENWDVKGTDGTEWYKPLYNLQNSAVSNFKVYMDNKELTYKTWNVDESLSQKAGYYGINYVADGIELCFGKADYNRHKFKLEYDFSNAIFNTSDAQVFYNQVIQPVWNVNFHDYSVTIHSYYYFPDSENDPAFVHVWGFGTKGFTYVKDGVISSSPDGSIDTEQPVTFLVKFPKGTFDTNNVIEGYNTFDEVLAIAKKDTFEYDYSDGTTKKQSLISRIINFISRIIYILIPAGIIGGAAYSASVNDYGYKGNKTINKKEVPMFRDIPCNRDIYYANALINLNKFEYKETNIFGAIILRWIRQDKIAFKNETRGIFNKETSIIDLTKNPTFDNPLEEELFDMMYKASKDGYLEPRELENWARNNHDKFLNLFKKISNNKIDELRSSNHIYRRVNKDECKKKNVMDDMIYEDSVKLYGLKKFFKEFSDMKSKEPIEVKLWDEYLMFAYLFGVADKVAKQFKNLYPEIVTEMEANNIDYGTFVYINTLSTKTVSAASAARAAAESYHGGGGGFNIGGGGGGSIGGGGGGISR